MRTIQIFSITILILFFSILSTPLFAAPEGHDTHDTSVTSQSNIQLEIEKIEPQGDQKEVTVKLLQDDKPLTLNDLKEIHTKKVHLLIIDDSLQDYFHVHPTPAQQPGTYKFSWHPKKEGHYRIWADIEPVSTGQQLYVMNDLEKMTNKKATIDRKVNFKNAVDGYTFIWSFIPNDLRVNKATMATLNITDSKGQPVKNLEPLMGAFAHVVGFSEDFKTIEHIHPMGKEPTNDNERGGSELQFHITPTQAGFMKLFVQVKINDKELYVPFGIVVK